MGAAIDAADDLDVSRHFRSDLDLGALANFGHVRLGLTVKNVTEPTFGVGVDALTLQRQARAGVAVMSVPNGAFQGWTFAADADLTTQSTVLGNVRHVAGGVEGWLASQAAAPAAISATATSARRDGGRARGQRSFSLMPPKLRSSTRAITDCSASARSRSMPRRSVWRRSGIRRSLAAGGWGAVSTS